MTLRFISLFAGIGGLDLGLERAGMECVAQVEIDDYATRVLAKHWPNVPRYRDVRTVGAHNLPACDLICGGFPCQDISNAGKRAGIDGERSGLWSEYARIVCELRPRYVLVENVAALLGRGLGRVLGDLAEIGYDAEWECVPAAAVGAPHLRDRLFIVAYARSERRGHSSVIDRKHAIPRDKQWNAAKGVRQWAGWQHWLGSLVQDGNAIGAGSGLLGMANGIPYRVERIKGLGNAVVPQVAEFIGHCIAAHARG